MPDPTFDPAKIFQTDPLNLTNEDIEQVIEVYRAKRNQFNLGDMKAGSLKKSVPKALAGASKEVMDLEVKL